MFAKAVSMAADESVAGKDGRIDTGKIGMIFCEFFSSSCRLGEKVGKFGYTVTKEKTKQRKGIL